MQTNDYYWIIRFCEGSQVRHNTPEEGQKVYRLKRCDYDSKDDDNSPNILGDENYQASSKKFG